MLMMMMMIIQEERKKNGRRAGALDKLWNELRNLNSQPNRQQENSFIKKQEETAINLLEMDLIFFFLQTLL